MNARTMQDFNSILKQWQEFQQSKLKIKMANIHPCSFHTEDEGSTIHLPHVTLQFITESGAHRLEFRPSFGFDLIIILLSDLRGFNVGATNIELILEPERSLGSPIVEFQTRAVQQLVLEQLEIFTRKMEGGVPRSPSSESD